MVVIVVPPVCAIIISGRFSVFIVASVDDNMVVVWPVIHSWRKGGGGVTGDLFSCSLWW